MQHVRAVIVILPQPQLVGHAIETGSIGPTPDEEADVCVVRLVVVDVSCAHGYFVEGGDQRRQGSPPPLSTVVYYTAPYLLATWVASCIF